jgi:hypothetical protein
MKRILSIIVLALVASFAVGQGVPPMPLPLPLPIPQIPQPLPQPIKPLTPTLPSLPPAPTPIPTKPAQPAQPAQPAPKPARFVLASEKTADLTGRWRLALTSTYPSAAPLTNGQRNTLHLVDTPLGVQGHYSLGSEECSVSGWSNGTGNDGRMSLRIVCGTWSVQLDGAIELEGSEVQGIYTSNKFGPGKFKMVKTPCWLPEGCKN